MVVAMRWVFALLLLGNIAFFAAMQLPQGKAGSEAMASHAPYLAEKIRLIAEDETPATAPSHPAATPVSPQVCLEWGLFAEQELVQARAALKPLKLGDSDISVRSVPAKASSYWVYIPPLKSRPEANKKVEELKALGIQDSFVMQDNNKWRYAVSLGVFSTQEAADKHLAELRAKNVKSAKSEPRTLEDDRSSMIIKAGGANIEAELVKLKQDFPATELKAVPCPQ